MEAAAFVGRYDVTLETPEIGEVKGLRRRLEGVVGELFPDLTARRKPVAEEPKAEEQPEVKATQPPKNADEFISGAPAQLKTWLSDHREASFGSAYGCLIKELRLLSRAIFVVDAHDALRHVEYVAEVATHPNYDAALAAARQLA